MDESVFWMRIWLTFGIVLAVISVSVAYYNDHLNKMRFDAWNQCLASGGEPKDSPIIGSNDTTFTCEKK